VNSNKMTNLLLSYYAHVAATNNWVDNNPRNILNGYIPTTQYFCKLVGSICGFVVTYSFFVS